MRILFGSKGEKALAIAGFAHDLHLEMKSKVPTTLEKLEIHNNTESHNIQRIDEALTKVIKSITTEEMVDIALVEKDAILERAINSASYAGLTSNLADSLNLDADLLGGSLPFIVNGIDMTVSGTLLSHEQRSDTVDMIEDFTSKIGIDNALLASIISKMDRAKNTHEFESAMLRFISSEQTAQNLETQIVLGQDNKALTMTATNQLGMSPKL
jgi:trans-2-enoyl-CoA reductase